MKINSKALSKICVVVSLILSAATYANTPRTDGPQGTEYGHPSDWNGQLQIGGQFGAILDSKDSDNSGFALGGDIDFRPYDVFGFRATFLQSVQKPRNSLLSLTPIAYTDYSNLRPYLMFGPGIARIDRPNDDFTFKFSLNFGAGADFMFTDHLGFGMGYMYHAIFGVRDENSVTARICFAFGI